MKAFNQFLIPIFVGLITVVSIACESQVADSDAPNARIVDPDILKEDTIIETTDGTTPCGKDLICANDSKCAMEKVFHPKMGTTKTTYACHCTDKYYGSQCDKFEYDDDEFEYDPDILDDDRTDCGGLICHNYGRCEMTKVFHPKTGETNTKYECDCTENYHGTRCKHEYNQYYDDNGAALLPLGAILGLVLTVLLIATIIIIISLRYCCTKKKIAASATGHRDDVDDVLDAEEASLPYWKKVID